MIPASAVLSPVPVTSTRSDPGPFTVPAMTRSEARFFTGRDSPVIIDSSSTLSPDLTAPSAGTRAPGRTRTVSPSRSAKSGTSSSPSAVIRTAADGRSFASSSSAPCACEMERISIQWPSSMTVTSVESSSQSGIPG
jgi:hypothetical protein